MQLCTGLNNMSFKKLLHKTKKRYAIKESELARLLGVSRQRLNKLKTIKGKIIIENYEMLEKIRKANRFTPSELIEYLRK